ncbi:hypothetical protein C3F09_04490 [candidate division GN15 bacterium]|uniref:Pilus assembly protein PilM n=1 Tax=candidate division GN15 bacterium TaxID=2072418 RepID=A0A855X4S4_9BACT|nr:MAG: hypothetical protein C3F09_04490 [candidate division GN15 bacterium]
MTSILRTGIDPQPNRTLVAHTLVDDAGAIECSVELHTGAGYEISSGVPIGIAVPDHEVAVKLLYLSPGATPDFQSRAAFELVQSVLEPGELFQFDAFPTSMRDRFLGLIYRRERLHALTSELLTAQNGSTPEPQFLMRAVALGLGYGRFAQPDSDSLVCLADLAGNAVSLCILYNRTIVAVAHMSSGNTPLADDRSRRAFGIDLKSLVNFHLAGCARHGLSVPLSVVVLCGGLAEPAVQESLAALFSARTVMPQKIESVRFDCPHESIRFSDCLAALGLTVN